MYDSLCSADLAVSRMYSQRQKMLAQMHGSTEKSGLLAGADRKMNAILYIAVFCGVINLFQATHSI
jgi:hypothetical protein